MRRLAAMIASGVILVWVPGHALAQPGGLWPEFENLCIATGGDLTKVGRSAYERGYGQGRLVMAPKKPGESKVVAATIPADSPPSSSTPMTFVKGSRDGPVIIIAQRGDYPRGGQIAAQGCSVNGPRLSREDMKMLEAWLAVRPAKKTGEETTYLLTADRPHKPLPPADSQNALLQAHAGYTIVNVRRSKGRASIQIWTYRRTS